jgi:hypothetical protein
MRDHIVPAVVVFGALVVTAIALALVVIHVT